MTKKDEAATNSRRNFLKMASVAAPAVVVAVTGEAVIAETLDQNEDKGLQDTAHTRAYFETARF